MPAANQKLADFKSVKNKFATPQRHIIRIGFSFHFLRAIKAAIKRKRANTFTEEMCKAFPERTAV